MRKQAYIHLHGLFCIMEQHLQDERDVDVERDAYGPEHPSPTAIHRSKSDQCEAVQAIASDVAQSVGGE